MRWFVLICALAFWGTVGQVSAMDRAATVEKALAATVTVYSADMRARFLGSGFAFGDPRTVVTNAHVVGRETQVLLIAHDGSRRFARVIALDELRDLAVLRLNDPLPVALEPATGTILVGAPVLAFGAPLEAGFSVTQGIVSAVSRQIDPQQPVAYIQHSAAVNPGSSGGVLTNEAGQVVGINTRIADGSRFFVGIAYAIPIAEVVRLLEMPRQTDGVAPGFLVRPLSPMIRRALGFDGLGVLLDHVAAGSPAARAGMQAGDILTKLNSQDITTPGDIAFALADAKPQIEATFIRDGDSETVILELTVPDRPIAAVPPQAPVRKTDYSLMEMGIHAGSDGRITKMGEDGAGFFAGLSEGDVIVRVNGTDISGMSPNWVEMLRISEPALLLIRLSDGSTQHFLLDPWEDGRGFRPSSGANVMDQEVVRFD